MRNLEGSWYLFRYEENVEMLGNAGLFANDPATAGRQSSIPLAFQPVATTFQRWLGGRDGDDHKRLRSVLAKAFTPKRIAAFRPRVEEITTKLITSTIERNGESFDLVREFAFQLPMAVVGDTLGVPEDDWPRLQGWSAMLSEAIEKPTDTAAGAAGGEAMAHMVDYFKEMIVRRRAAPGGDLLSAMIVLADDEEHTLDERDVIAVATELGFAGHETTTNSIAKSVMGLMDQRERWEELRTLTDAALDKAIEELLRWTCPVQRQRWRWATADAILGGRKIERGQSVVSVLAAANRDPAHFPEPDRIDFHRRDGRHLTFGFGNHFCLGHQLAKMEIGAVVPKLASLFPALTLAVAPGDVPMKRHFGLPGPRSLPVRI
jgi:cytochrome P450